MENSFELEKRIDNIDNVEFVLNLSFKEVIMLETLIDMNNVGCAYRYTDELKDLKEKIFTQTCLQQKKN